MSLSQKVILGGITIVFVVGIGWAFQYVSQSNFHLGRGNGTMMSGATKEEGAVVRSRIEKETSQSGTDQDGTSVLIQPVSPAPAATIESKAQAEQALLEIEKSFGEIEVDISANE